MNRWDEQKLSSPYQVYIEETRTFCNEFASAVKINKKWSETPLLFFFLLLIFLLFFHHFRVYDLDDTELLHHWDYTYKFIQKAK